MENSHVKTEKKKRKRSKAQSHDCNDENDQGSSSKKENVADLIPRITSSTRQDLGLKVEFLTNAGKDEDTSKDIPEPFAPSCLDSKCSTSSSILLQLAQQTLSKLHKQRVITPKPTPIQLQSWSILNTDSESPSSQKSVRKRMIAISPTGSGKTLAYVIPLEAQCIHLFEQCNTQIPRRFVYALILVPTRELAIQVSKVVKNVTKRANKILLKSGTMKNQGKMTSLAIFGGVDKQEQVDALIGKKEENGTCKTALIVTATPGRLIDLLGLTVKAEGKGENVACIGKEIVSSSNREQIRSLFGTNVKACIIDEADRMATQADIREQVDLILKDLLPRSEDNNITQTMCLYSATLPQRVKPKFDEWLGFPRYIVSVDNLTVGTLGHENGKDVASSGEMEEGIKKNLAPTGKRDQNIHFSRIPSNITQILHVCANHKKPKKLIHTLKKIRTEENKDSNRRHKGLTMVFFGRIKTLQYISSMLRKEGISCADLHGQMNQQKRESQLNLFRCGKIPILLATDVAARGLHVNNVESIVNYDFPCKYNLIN